MSNKKINDGGPAFPHDISDRTPGHPGMSLRDYLAAKAMQGLLASGSTINGKRDVAARDYVPLAYEFADAMIAAREANT